MLKCKNHCLTPYLLLLLLILYVLSYIPSFMPGFKKYIYIFFVGMYLGSQCSLSHWMPNNTCLYHVSSTTIDSFHFWNFPNIVPAIFITTLCYIVLIKLLISLLPLKNFPIRIIWISAFSYNGLPYRRPIQSSRTT